MEIQGFYPAEETPGKSVLMYSQKTFYRRVNTLIYAECVTKTFSKTGVPEQHFREIMLLTPQSKKYYREDPIGNEHPSGRIDKNVDNELSGWLSLTPDVVFWGNLTWPGLEARYSDFFRKNADMVSIVYDETLQAYILNTPMGTEENAPRYRYTVDPSKGYMPRVQEWLNWNNTLIQKNVCGDYRQVNGLWAPFQYRIYDSNGNLATYVTIKSLSINQADKADKVAFQFPSGTRVRDRILGVAYTVDAKEVSKESISTDEPNTQAIGLAPAATDEQLAQVAIKAQQLLEKQTEAGDKKSPAVYPEYVWIEPGKKEYSLLLAGEKDKRSAMVNYRFDGGGLVLHDLKDQIADSGRIQLTIERPAEMSGYGEGTLELDFAGQSKTIHLIAPPILK
jgi:hypothetical protein